MKISRKNIIDLIRGIYCDLILLSHCQLFIASFYLIKFMAEMMQKMGKQFTLSPLAVLMEYSEIFEGCKNDNF